MALKPLTTLFLFTNAKILINTETQLSISKKRLTTLFSIQTLARLVALRHVQQYPDHFLAKALGL